jgi:hypothetical protein
VASFSKLRLQITQFPGRATRPTRTITFLA